MSQAAGSLVLLGHAEFPDSPILTNFAKYRGFLQLPEFEASPTDELHLLLLLKDIKRTLSRPVPVSDRPGHIRID